MPPDEGSMIVPFIVLGVMVVGGMAGWLAGMLLGGLYALFCYLRKPRASADTRRAGELKPSPPEGFVDPRLDL
jgi:hypothetical protein